MPHFLALQLAGLHSGSATPESGQTALQSWVLFVRNIGAPVHQDLADLDALAAGAQRVLHGLSAADDGHPAQLLGKVDARVGVPRRRHHALLLEGQVPQAVLHHLHQPPDVSCRGPCREVRVPGALPGLGRAGYTGESVKSLPPRGFQVGRQGTHDV